LSVFIEVLSAAIAGEARLKVRRAMATRWTGAAESLDIVSSTFREIRGCLTRPWKVARATPPGHR
jgi:hypothetical protein